MADAKVAPNKLAMSRALGAAFLNHQVEQLEKTVHTGGNWRGRRSPETWRGETKRTVSGPGPKIMRRRNDDGEDRPRAESETTAREERRSEERKVQKDADVVVVDATVLVHGLYHIKKWCREGREEVIIIPLEALNTLDLLKKGTTVLAQRARAASRILEAQVGTNLRIRVQQDDAFVPWDNIPFDDQPGSAVNTAPEWVRRTICCALWEVDHAGEAQKDGKPSKPRVVLAVVSPPADGPAESANPAPVSASPVPLPAPQPNKYESRLSGALVGRWASKAGMEVLEVTSAPPSSQSGNAPTDAPTKARRSTEGRRSAEDERAKRGQSHGQSGRGRRNSRGTTPGARPPPATGTGLVERPPAVMAMMEMVAQPSRVVRVLARGEKLDP